MRRPAPRVILPLLFWILSTPLAADDNLAHPALWHIARDGSEVYLLGSLHFLPPALDWREGKIADAIGQSDVFVFEIPLDAAANAHIQEVVAKEGMLPEGKSLHAMLSPEARAKLDVLAARANVPPQAIDGMRPWLAAMLLATSRIATQKGSPEAGPDVVLASYAQQKGKELRYLETVDQQLNVIVPSDPKVELAEFDAALKELTTDDDEYNDMVAAWRKGNAQKLDQLVESEFADDPDARKAVLDDRNKEWVPEIEAMLKEKKVFFITVGAGHLLGKAGVPALLRADGYQVDGP
jgi:uncharacterized protein YbaP (TraB family)